MRAEVKATHWSMKKKQTYWFVTFEGFHNSIMRVVAMLDIAKRNCLSTANVLASQASISFHKKGLSVAETDCTYM